MIRKDKNQFDNQTAMFPTDTNPLDPNPDLSTLCNTALLPQHQPMTVQNVIQNYAAQNKNANANQNNNNPPKQNYSNRTFQLLENVIDPEEHMPVKHCLDDEIDKKRQQGLMRSPHSSKSQKGDSHNQGDQNRNGNSQNANFNQNLIPQGDGSHILYQTDPVTGIPHPIHIPAGHPIPGMENNNPVQNGPEESGKNGSDSDTQNSNNNNTNTSKQPYQEEEHYDRVFIWDLDETLILLHSLTNGTYANRFGQNANIAFNLGSRVEQVVSEFAELNLFWRELDDCDQVHIDDIQAEENNQLNQNAQMNAEAVAAQSANVNPNESGAAGQNPQTTTGVADPNNAQTPNATEVPNPQMSQDLAAAAAYMGNFNHLASLAMANQMGAPGTVGDEKAQQQAAAALQAQQVAIHAAAMAAATPIVNVENRAGNLAVQNPGQAAANDWMRKMSFRYNRIREVYDGYKDNPHSLLNPQIKEALDKAHSDINIITENWMTVAYNCLTMISKRPKNKNIIVSSSQLIHTLSKLLVHKISKFFDIKDIYSASKIGKDSCFERVSSRFGKHSTYVCIGDGRDEESAAKMHGMPFWPIACHGDLLALEEAIFKDFL